ncbi:MAG: sulfatase/phosphatase domain-containing protein, partial [Candidatus Latescibacterota bacterium]
AEVESVDERIGFVVSLLAHKNLLDKTYIIVTSDHGEQFGDHGLFGHGGFGRGCHYYEGLVKIPLLIYGPGISAGRRITGSVSNVDLMPTLKDLLHIAYEDHMQGESFKMLLFEKTDWKRTIYLHDVQEHDQLDALVENDYKLICLGDDKYELYNLAADPGEENNIADANAKRVKSMLATIEKFRADNKERKKANIAALGDDMEEKSEAEKRKIMRQLKSLGYVE